MRKIAVLLLCILFVLPVQAQAKKVLKTVQKTETVVEEVDDSEAGMPAPSPWGLYGSVFGDPGINLLGVNLAFQANDDVRIDFGFGTLLSDGNSLGFDVKYFIPTQSRFRPFFGLGITALFMNVFDSPQTASIDFPPVSLIYPSIKAGVEYHAPTGFFVSLHISTFFFFYGSQTRTVIFDPIPALSIGSFF